MQSQLQDRSSLLTQISQLKSDMESQKNLSGSEKTGLQGKLEQCQTQLSVCTQEKTSIQSSFMKIGANGDSQMDQLRQENLNLNKRVSTAETLNSECRASLNFFVNVDQQLKNLQTQLNSTLQDNQKLRNDNQILQNDKAGLNLQLATIPQMEKRIADLQAQNASLQDFTKSINLL